MPAWTRISFMPWTSAFLLAVLFPAVPVHADGDCPPRAPVPGDLAKEQREKRDRLKQNLQALHAEGKLIEAIAAAEDLLQLERQVHGETSEEAVKAMDSLATLHEERGDWTRAVALRERVLASRTRLRGQTHWATVGARWALERAKAVERLGADEQRRFTDSEAMIPRVRKLFGERHYEEAEGLIRRIMAERRAVLGENHPDLAADLGALAGVRWNQGDRAGGLAFYEQALAVRERLLGRRHPDTARSLEQLARVRAAAHDAGRARDLYERAVAIFAETAGEGSRDFVSASVGLSKALRSTGDLAGALAALERAVAARRTSRGPRSLEVATALHEMAEVLEDRGDLAKAQQRYEEALSLFRELKQERSAEYAGVMNDLGVLLEDRAMLAEARPYFEQALALRRELLGEQHPDYDQTLRNLARLSKIRGDLAAAADLFEQLVALRKRRHAAVSEIESALWSLAEIHEARDDWNAAAAVLRERRDSLNRRLGAGHWQSADARWELVRAEALAHLDRDRRRKVLDALDVKSKIDKLKADGRLDEALGLAREAETIVREALGPGNPFALDAILQQALILVDRDDKDGAHRLFARIVDAQREARGESHPQYARSLYNLALSQKNRGDLAEALALFRRAAELLEATRGGRDPEVLTCLEKAADLAFTLGESAAARVLYRRLLALRKEVPGEKRLDYARALYGYARYLRQQSDPSTARPVCEEALAIVKAASGEQDLGVLSVLDELARIRHDQGDYAEARSLYERALALRKALVGETDAEYAGELEGLGGVLDSLGDRAGTRAAWTRALEIRARRPDSDPFGYARILHNFALLRAGDGDLSGARRDLDEALRYYEMDIARSLPGLPERQQIDVLGRYRRPLWLALSLSAGQSDRVEADYRRLLGWKGLATDAAAHRKAALARMRAGERMTRVNAIRDRLTLLYYEAGAGGGAEERAREILRVAQERESLELSLSRAVPWEPRPVTPKQVAAALPRDAALIDLIRYTHHTPPPRIGGAWEAEDRYCAFVVRAGSTPMRVDLGAADLIDDALASWRARLARRDDESDALGAEIRQLVWGPLEATLRGARVVLVAPDGDLCYLPWPAVPDRTSGSFLIRRYAFATVASGRQIVELAQNSAIGDGTPGSLLVVGGVDYGDVPKDGRTGGQRVLLRALSAGSTRGLAGFCTLPGSRSEALTIASLWQTNNGAVSVQSLSGADADKARLRAAVVGARYIHLATHGYFAVPELNSALVPAPDAASAYSFEGGMCRNAESLWYPGLLCGLACAGAADPPKDPATGALEVGACLLSAEEAAGLDLRTCTLAVLSACETGLGRTAGGEGVLSLQRAFHQAGARTVVASFWKVDDAATSALMTRFYANLWAEKMAPLEALRQAQLSMLDDPAFGEGAHPRLWAAWSLSGDPGGLPQHPPATARSADAP